MKWSFFKLDGFDLFSIRSLKRYFKLEFNPFPASFYAYFFSYHFNDAATPQLSVKRKKNQM